MLTTILILWALCGVYAFNQAYRIGRSNDIDTAGLLFGVTALALCGPISVACMLPINKLELDRFYIPAGFTRPELLQPATVNNTTTAEDTLLLEEANREVEQFLEECDG